ncbi:hypothetical protein Taro_000331, partial [Colocasia esculenta]|nr:hypothetical protein [Colocasia esculenta]
MPMDYVMEAASRAHFSGLRLASPDGLHLLSTSPPTPTPSASPSPTAAAASAAKSLLLPSPPVAESPAGRPCADDGPRQPFVIGVSGGTASGKTTVCDMIIQQLHDHRVVLVNQDSFYRGLTAEESERVHEYNFDHPDAFDTEQLLECIGKLKGGKSVNVPIYDFKNHRRCSESFRKVNASDVIILEAIPASEVVGDRSGEAPLNVPSSSRCRRAGSPPLHNREFVSSSQVAMGFLPEAENDESPSHDPFFGTTTMEGDNTTFTFAELGLSTERYHSAPVEAYVSMLVGGCPTVGTASEYADIRLARRIRRDTVERGRDVNSVLEQ